MLQKDFAGVFSKPCLLPFLVFSSSFTYNRAEHIRKGVICVQILSELHLTEHGRFFFQGRTTFYKPVIVTFSRHMASK